MVLQHAGPRPPAFFDRRPDPAPLDAVMGPTRLRGFAQTCGWAKTLPARRLPPAVRRPPHRRFHRRGCAATRINNQLGICRDRNTLGAPQILTDSNPGTCAAARDRNPVCRPCLSQRRYSSDRDDGRDNPQISFLVTNGRARSDLCELSATSVLVETGHLHAGIHASRCWQSGFLSPGREPVAAGEAA